MPTNRTTGDVLEQEIKDSRICILVMDDRIYVRLGTYENQMSRALKGEKSDSKDKIMPNWIGNFGSGDDTTLSIARGLAVFVDGLNMIHMVDSPRSELMMELFHLLAFLSYLIK